MKPIKGAFKTNHIELQLQVS